MIENKQVNVNYGVSKETMENINQLLNLLLADEIIFTMKLRTYHWNVKGVYFKQLHELFEEQYDETFDIADEIAEYIRTYNGTPLMTLKEALELTHLNENTTNIQSTKAMLEDILRSHEIIIQNLRVDAETAGNELNEPAIEDFLIGIVHKHQKMAWFIQMSLSQENL